MLYLLSTKIKLKNKKKEGMELKKLSKRIAAALTGAVMTAALFIAVPNEAVPVETGMTANAASLTIDDLPSNYKDAADWIWNNRISAEDSTASKSKHYNLIFDQIIAGKGTLNYVVRWQSYKQLTLAQRQGFEKLVEDGINSWTDYLVGYENWPYDHVDVNIVGWAVLDSSCILDKQPDEVVWDNLLTDYDSSGDTSNGVEEIPNKLPSAPEELWSFNYWNDRNHVYPGTRFDMYLWCTQGFPNIGGCGGDWGQRLSDNAYLSLAEGTGFPHVHIHEVGHGFGMTDFYGGEGASDGFPPGGFPGNGTSIMMAGSSSEITDFDGWMLRYMWTKLSDESGRFDMANAQPEPIEPTEPTIEPTDTTEETVLAEPGGFIELNSKPAKTVYKTGEQLDLTGLAVSLKYFPGGAIPESQLDKYELIYNNVNPLDYPNDFVVDTSAFNSNAAGTYTIKVKCTDDTANRYWAANSEVSFDVTVEQSQAETKTIEFTDTITSVSDGKITFAQNGEFTFGGDYYDGDPQKNLMHYEVGDVVKISMTVADKKIVKVNSIEWLNQGSDIVDYDVNNNGSFELSDIVMLQKYLAKAGDVTDKQAADANKDEKINIFDLVIIKRHYIDSYYNK